MVVLRGYGFVEKIIYMKFFCEYEYGCVDSYSRLPEMMSSIC